MDRCLAREKWVNRLREKAEAIETKLNELKVWKDVQVKKLIMTKKALEESESHGNELRKVLLDKEREITTLREQVCHAKVVREVEFQDFDGFLTELSNCYSYCFNEFLR